MKPRVIGFTLAFLLALMTLRVVSAQSFLERITQQLQQGGNQEGAPPLQSADEPRPTPAREVLPPPRDSVTAPPTRGSLGLRVSDVTEDAVRRYQLVVRRGALITSVEKGSAAERAGLTVGSVIVALDGRRIDSPEDLVDAVRAIRPARDVDVTFYERDRMSRKIVPISPSQASDVSTNLDRRINPAPTPMPPTAPPTGLGQQLRGNPSRPLLGRIGSLLDSVVTQAQAIEPQATAPQATTPAPTVANRIDPNSEIVLLRAQVDQLQRQVEALQKSIESLEKRLDERK